MPSTRLLFATLALCLVPSCDPHNEITLRLRANADAAAPATVTAYWVKKYEGRLYIETAPIFKKSTVDATLMVTVGECCGTATAYRSKALWFVACVAKPNADPVLICGKAGASEATSSRSLAKGATCESIEATLGHADIDIDTCTLSPRAP